MLTVEYKQNVIIIIKLIISNSAFNIKTTMIYQDVHDLAQFFCGISD